MKQHFTNKAVAKQDEGHRDAPATEVKAQAVQAPKVLRKPGSTGTI